jgi:hypothetical protein
MDKLNFITMKQLADALGISRQYIYRINESIGTVEVGGVMCVSRAAALALVEAQIRQLTFRVERLQSAKSQIMVCNIDDDEVTE